MAEKWHHAILDIGDPTASSSTMDRGDLLSLIPASRRSRRRRGGEEPGRHWRFSRAAEEREKKEDKWALPELPRIENCFVSAYLELNQIM
jgi:hypothetical protein